MCVHMNMHACMHVDRYGYDCLYMYVYYICTCLLMLLN